MTGLFDLHCDTLTRDRYAGNTTDTSNISDTGDTGGTTGTTNTLDNPQHHLALRKIPPGTPWVECYAIFIPDSLRGQDAVSFFEHYVQFFRTQVTAKRTKLAACRTFSDLDRAISAGKFAGILTVEGGCVLAGDLARIKTIWKAGVRMLTLTWNGKNELGSGHDSEEGLTDFGREAVAELERQGVIIDVSHLNDRGFSDLAEIAKKPFIASHSNARAVTNHPRNLPDAFIEEIMLRGGLIGLNFASVFLTSGADGGMDDLLRHVDHFLELGAARCLALGSDYDGADIHPDLNSVEKALSLYDALARHGLPIDTVNDILFRNAWRFFGRWLCK